MTADGRVLLRVRVTPRARTTAVSLDGNGVLRVRLTASPVEGAANRALIELLAEGLGLKRGAFEVVRGGRSRDKVVAVRDCSEAELTEHLRRLVGAADVDKAKRHG